MMPVWKSVLELGKDNFKVMVYSGDDDSICATLGTQQWVWDMGFTASETWTPWHFQNTEDDGQVAGFTTKFKEGMSFVTVHGAGHMVPQTRPAQSLQLMSAFVADDW